MSKEERALERAALDAHRRGDTWATFWASHAEQVRAVEPYDRDAYRRLVSRLLALVVSGDLDGQEPAGDAMPWTVDDDAGKPADVRTQARCLWPIVQGEATP